MSKHGPCELSHHNEPAIAWWRTSNGNFTRLCQSCLGCWFDNADDDPDLEPTAWGWLYTRTGQLHDGMTAALRDPANRAVVAEILQRGARAGAQWLRDFIAREQRMHRVVPA